MKVNHYQFLAFALALAVGVANPGWCVDPVAADYVTAITDFKAGLGPIVVAALPIVGALLVIAMGPRVILKLIKMFSR